MASVTAPEAIVSGSTSIESVFPNYSNALRAVMAEHEVALAGLSKWKVDYDTSGLALVDFLAQREEEIRTSFSDHRQRIGSLIGLMPGVVSDLTDLSDEHRAVFERASSEPDLNQASAIVRQGITDDLTRRAVLAGAVDPRLYDHWIQTPNPDEGDIDISRLSSGRAAREANLSMRDGDLLDLVGNKTPAEAEIFLKRHASSSAARSALRAAFDRQLVDSAHTASSFEEGSRLFTHGSPNMNGKAKHSHRARAKTAKHNINGARADALKGRHSHRTLKEELAFEEKRFRKQFPDIPEAINLFGQAGFISESGEQWLNKHPAVLRRWQKIERRVRKNHPDAQAHAAREANEQAEARRRANEQAQREAREARERAEQAEHDRQQRRQQTWDDFRNRWQQGRQAGNEQQRQGTNGRGQGPSGQTPPRGQQRTGNTQHGQTQEPPREARPRRLMHLSEEELARIYDHVRTNIISRPVAYDGFLRTYDSYEQEDVLWVIDRIIVARRQSASHSEKGESLTDKKIFDQFFKRGGSGVANPHPDDTLAAQVVGTLMGKPGRSGELPFKHGLAGHPHGPTV